MVGHFNEPAAPRSALRQSLEEGWALASPFWRATKQWRSWVLLASVVALTLCAVWLNVRFSSWNNSFYNTLQNHDLLALWRQFSVFGMLATAFIAVAVYRQYLQQLRFMRWRTWLTDHLLKEWVQKWSGLFEQLCAIFKWIPGGLGRCRVVHGGGRRLRRTTDAVGNSGRTADSFYAASCSLGNAFQ